MIDDDTIRSLVTRLARRHASGGEVIERAAILASGADSAAVLTWIADHHGEPEVAPASKTNGSLHGGRLSGGASVGSQAPRRYVLPPGVLH
jgi:hypothetical protein